MAQPAAKKKPIPLRPSGSKKSSLKATIKDQSGAGKTRIGELLCKEGHITSRQLQEALNHQKKHQGRLGSILLKLGYIEEETIVNVLSRLHNFPAAIISKSTPETEALEILPYEMAKILVLFLMRFLFPRLLGHTSGQNTNVVLHSDLL